MSDTHLRRYAVGFQQPWAKKELLAGLQHFQRLHGRFPTAQEIDSFPYLPSSRSIQRAYGGLVALRKELLPQEIANYTTGVHRSEKAHIAYTNSRNYEDTFYKYLIDNFAEIAVHEHKVIRPGSVSSDFYIYLSPNTGIVVDIFYADSLRNLVNVVNIKLKRYVLISQETYLVVVGNEAIDAGELVAKMGNKKHPLPRHISVLTEHEFKALVIPELKARSTYGKL